MKENICNDQGIEVSKVKEDARFKREDCKEKLLFNERKKKKKKERRKKKIEDLSNLQFNDRVTSVSEGIILYVEKT